MESNPRPPEHRLDELELLRRRVAELEGRELAVDWPADRDDLFRRLVEDSLGLMCVHDLDGNLIFVNAAAAQTLGFRPEDGVGWNLRRFLAPAIAPLFDSYLERIRHNSVDNGLMRVVSKDGDERVWMYRNVLHQEPGKPARVLGHAQDVTDRVAAEGALRESEQRFRLLADTAPVLIWMSDPGGQCTFLNQPWLDFTGRTREDALGLGWLDSVHPDDRAAFEGAHRAAVAGHRPFQLEHRLRRADGEYRWILGRGVPRTAATDGVAGLIGSSVDVTEIRQARVALERARDDLAGIVAERTAELERRNEQLRAEMRHRARIEEEVARVRRIESLGVLASGMAHEFNNLLTVILGRSQLLQDRLADDEAARTDLDFVERAAQRAAALTHQLLAFGAQQVLERRPVDVNELIAGLSLPTLVNGPVDVRLDDQLWTATADPVQLRLMILRLLEHARDAMTDGGHFAVETANVELDDGFAASHPGAQPGPHVRLTVRHAGLALDELTRSHLFEPFFTARLGVHGSGLDLAAVYGTARAHGGHIAVESDPERGTAFVLHLPAASPAPADAPARTGLRGTETILLVEADPDARGLHRNALEHHGYRVIEAPDAEAALSMAASREPIQLVIAAVSMARISGPVLADRLSAIRPDVRMLYLAGPAADDAAAEEAVEAALPVLRKPFSAPSLLLKVRAVLDA